MCMYVCMYVCVFMHACLCVCMYVCMYVCMLHELIHCQERISIFATCQSRSTRKFNCNERKKGSLLKFLQVLAPARRTQGPEILPSSVKNVLPQSVKPYVKYIWLCPCVYVYVRTYVCVYLCMYVCMYVCEHASMFAYTYVSHQQQLTYMHAYVCNTLRVVSLRMILLLHI